MNIFYKILCFMVFLASPLCAIAENGVTDKEILIGSSLALTGGTGYLGAQYKYGAMAYIEAVNDNGGVNGRQIKVSWRDDVYDPVLTLVNTRKLLEEDQVFCLFNYIGTTSAVKVLPMLAHHKVPLVGVLSGARILREPVNPYVFNVRSSYSNEIEAVVMHTVKDLGLKKVAVFYQYDAYGIDGLKSTEVVLEKYGLTPVSAESYDRGSTDIREPLKAIQASGAELVIMVGVYEACAKFIIEGKKQGFHPVYYNVSFVGPEKLVELLGESGQGELLTLVVPPLSEARPPEPAVADIVPYGVAALPVVPVAPQPTGFQGITDYINTLQQYFPVAPSTVSFEGFINAKVLVEALKRAGPDLTREKFIGAVESIKNFDLGIGSNSTFGPADHQGLDQVYVVRIDKGGMVPVVDWAGLKKKF
ncbi:MAG: ABC transporter substrate-binding protein [Candidatus Omnitrophica bacterium]|nr:ABC transporter substrate-binding protein [Candidatus Omnitrophota bacterium]